MANQPLSDKAYKRPLVIILWILLVPIAILAIVLSIRAVSGANVNLWGLVISKCEPEIKTVEVPVTQRTIDSIKSSIKEDVEKQYAKMHMSQPKEKATVSTKVTNQGDVKNQNNGPNYGQVGDVTYERGLSEEENRYLINFINGVKDSVPTLKNASIFPHAGAPPKVVAQIAQVFRDLGYVVNVGMHLSSPGETQLHQIEINHNKTNFFVEVGDLLQ